MRNANEILWSVRTVSTHHRSVVAAQLYYVRFGIPPKPSAHAAGVCLPHHQHEIKVKAVKVELKVDQGVNSRKRSVTL